MAPQLPAHSTALLPSPRIAPVLAVEMRGVTRRYGHGASAVHALRDVDLALPRGTFTVVMGASGSDGRIVYDELAVTA